MAENPVLAYVRKCRDTHVGPYPVSIREAAKATNLSEYTIRMVFDKLIDEGRLTRVAGHESRGVVLP
jgi:hypothetical protein